jgi:predicted nucleotidyltransferase
MIPAEKSEIYRAGLRQRLSRQLSKAEQSELDKAYDKAQELAQILVKEHSAQCVWLIGSVARRRPLRPDSDIDLAVEGMSSEAYYELVGDLHTESGRTIDLVRLENVRSAAKRVIFSEGIILVTATDNIHHLIIAIEAEIEHFQQLADDVDESITRFSTSDQMSIHDMRAIALLLTEIYLAAESLMLRVTKSLDEPVPIGQAWHTELLEQLSAEVANIRPALFSEDTANQLDEFRRFRHVVHHMYSFSYDWEQIRKLLNGAHPLLEKLTRDAQTFRAFLMDSIVDEDNKD